MSIVEVRVSRWDHLRPELEDTDEMMERRMQYCAPSEDEGSTEETEVTLRAQITWVATNIFDFIWPTSGVNRSATSHINAESSLLTLIIFVRQIFSNYVWWKQPLLWSVYDVPKHNKHFVKTTRYYERRILHIFFARLLFEWDENGESCGKSRRTWKRTKELRFHLAYVTILNVFNTGLWKGEKRECHLCWRRKETRHTCFSLRNITSVFV
jgi:hypothetical protein